MERLGQWRMVARVARTPALLRVESGYMAFSFGEHSTWLAILVYALARGGPREVGVVAVVLLVPGIVSAPFAAFAGDRFAPHRALAAGYAAQAVAMAATAIAMAAGAPIAAYVGAALAATFVTFTRPVMGTLLPTITHAPTDLVAANVVANLIEQIGVFVGPVVAGLLMAWQSPELVFGVAAAALGAACLSTFLLEPLAADEQAGQIDVRTVVGEVFAGFATLRRQPLVRMLVILGGVAGLLKGVGDVIFVTFADVRLDGGSGLPGLLAGAYGLGAIIGAAGSTRMMARGRASRSMIISAGLAGLGLLALSAIDSVGPAVFGFGVLGAGETVMGLAVFVTIQRSAPQKVLARVFGVLEGLQMAAIALGSLLVTVLVARMSMRVALASIAIAVVCAVGVGVARVRRLGADTMPVDDEVVERLLADPVLAPLAATMIERLARAATMREFAAGAVMVAEGEIGAHYYLMVDGTAEVSVTGRTVDELGGGDSFGEIALLRGTPRLATVCARTPVRTLVLGRDEFLEAVTGHPRSHRLASAKVDRHLAT